jgi:putative heme-binding domain-containing protein
LQPAARAAAAATLASRPESARALLDAVERGRVAREAVGAFLVRQMRGFDDEALSRRLDAAWPGVRAVSAEKREAIATYRERLLPAALSAADPSRGRAVFEKTCASCHRLFDRGAAIGPDLTGSDRRNLEYLLENILDPAATLADSFRMSIVVLADGRIINGVPGAAAERTLEVQTATEKLVLDRAAIASIRPTALSLMPEGLLEGLEDGAARDLIAYLMSPRQVPLPE